MKLSLKNTTPHQRLAARECPVSHYVPLSHLTAPDRFETKQGDQGCVIQVDGCAFALADARDLHVHQRRLAHFLVSLGDEFAVYVTTHRQRQHVYPSGDFAPGFAADFNAAYRAQREKSPLYTNQYYITLMIKQGRSQPTRKTPLFRQSLHRVLNHTVAECRKLQQAKLENTARDLMQALSAFNPRRLGDSPHTDPDTSGAPTSALLAFFSLLINGETCAGVLPPQHALDRYLPTRRLSFGHHTLEWQGNVAVARQFGAVLSIKHYGSASSPAAFGPVSRANAEYIQTHAFLRENNRVALARIRTQQKQLGDADDAALSQQVQLSEAMDWLASGQLVFGHYHHTLLVLADTLAELEANLATLSSCCRDANLIVVRESLGLESAFWAQLPGNFHHMHRRALISSDNFADFTAMHSEPVGHYDKNHLGSAVMVVETPCRSPLYVNFHERSEGKSALSKGHTTIIAPSNAGKTTLMNALDAQAQKYHGTSIFFDRDQGCELYVRAMGGRYTQLSPGQTTEFNPFQLADTPANRDFLTEWLTSLFNTADGANALAPSDLKVIADVAHRAYTLPLEKRQLSVVASFFPPHFAHQDALRPWLHGEGGRPDGRFAYLFDNPTDTLSFEHSHAGFDLTHLLDHAPSSVVFSVMLYLFHRIEAHSDGRLTGIYLDEGWQLLADPAWQAKLNAYLPTLRKRNVYLVFATQSPGTVARSPLRDALIQGSATNIFLPNPKADATHYCEGFKLSAREYAWVKDTDFHTRQFLIKQGTETAIGALNLTGLEDFIAVLSGNKTSVTLMNSLRKEVGSAPQDWLPLFHARRPR